MVPTTTKPNLLLGNGISFLVVDSLSTNQDTLRSEKEKSLSKNSQYENRINDVKIIEETDKYAIQRSGIYILSGDRKRKHK
jgi:hypothetical protein